MIAASAPRSLLIGKKDRTMRSTVACSRKRIAIGRSGYRGEAQVARENGAGEFRLQGAKIVHAYAGSATMLIEISAALAE